MHAFKPEPHNEIPQASTAHDNFWDFASLVPEPTHMNLWVLSDRAIPRSFRLMDGFGVNTFRFVNEPIAALTEEPSGPAPRRSSTRCQVSWPRRTYPPDPRE